jgi:uncharacterized protein YbjQ (UPF0145 family)
VTEDGAAWTAQLSTGEQAALAGVGFFPVGQVMGASVWSLNQTGRGNCGGQLLYGGTTPTRYSTGRGTPAGGYADPRLHPEASHVGRHRTWYMQQLGPLVDTYTRCRRAALRQLQDEAAALGADGVVGVKLTIAPFTASAQRSLSFIARGTAVRAAGSTHLDGPFLSDLNGTDLALLMRAGWAPTGLVMGVGAVVAHDGRTTVRRRQAWAGNIEIPGYSDLATQARADARSRLNEDIRLHSGEAAVLGNLAVSVHTQACGNGYRGSYPGYGYKTYPSGSGGVDHLVEAVLLGTAIARFELPPTSATPEPLPMLRLSRRPGRQDPATSVVIDPFTIRRGR